MTTQQTPWPCVPLALSYEVAVPSASYLANDYAGAAVPCFYSAVIGNPDPRDNRKFYLDRSLFDLVDAHPYLALTDPKLLGWYLCLSPEDRKIIQDEGGFHQFLQRHPALELSKHHVYVKYNGAVQSAMTSNKHTSLTPGPSMCSCGMSHTDQELKMLTNNVEDNLTMLDCTNRKNGSQKRQHEEICHTKGLVHLQDSFQTAHSSPITQEPKLKKRPSQQMASGGSSSMFVCKDPAALASFSLDMELDRCRQRGKPEQRSQGLMTQDQTANFTYAEVSPVQSKWSTIENKSPSEYYSFDSIQMDGTEHNDTSSIQSAELEQLNCPLDPVEENGAKKQGQDYMVYNNEDTVDKDDDAANLGLEDQSEDIYSIMDEDKSIIFCVASDGQKAYLGPVTTNSEALAASSEIMESDQSVSKRCTEKSKSPVPCVSTCDVMVFTELAQCVSAFTQTDDLKTADKHIITEVHMADLDYLAVEFFKLKTAQKELKEREKMKSSGCKLRNKCDCIQRAQQAELSLLTLQYSMCRQHCWSLYYTTAGGDQVNPLSVDMNQYWPQDLPANILSVLEKLESDYNELRDKILEGVPMKQLRPLSVDCEKITTATYIPAKERLSLLTQNIIDSVRGSVLSRCHQEPQRHSTPGDKIGCPDNESTNECQRKAKQVTQENSKARRAVTLVPQGGGAFLNAQKLVENQTTAACKELNTSEAWYDAEEDLEPAEPAAAAEMGQNLEVIEKDRTYESANEEAKSPVLRFSSLTRNVTESDVMLSFEKYHGSEVSISALNKDLSGPQSAEASVRKVNCSSMQGHALHVEHMNRAVGGTQRQASTSISGSESSQDATKPQTPKNDYSSAEKKLTTKPPLGSSIKNRQVVCILPTAKATCVPQHFGTMASFDTLIAELTQHHPDAGRQEIVGALVELRAKHQGVLSGLPLRTIREMASVLLTRPVGATQL